METPSLGLRRTLFNNDTLFSLMTMLDYYVLYSRNAEELGP